MLISCFALLVDGRSVSASVPLILTKTQLIAESIKFESLLFFKFIRSTFIQAPYSCCNIGQSSFAREQQIRVEMVGPAGGSLTRSFHASGGG